MLINQVLLLLHLLPFVGALMILPCGQKRLETVGAQPMTLMIHGQGGNLLALD